MDSLSLVRKEARGLHRRAHARLPDGWKAWALAEAAAKELSLTPVCCASDDPVLDGALAALSRQFGHVYYRDGLESEERASDVAHELGHYVVHNTEASYRCAATDVEAARPESSPPVGMARVQSYGARERKETQANIFAREFLLPREIVRRHFLGDRLGAKDIAAKYELPIHLVRQQLFDSLLLPDDIEVTEDGTRVEPPLDNFQQKAATADDRPHLIEAGPGTGKTRALVARLVHLIKDRRIDPAHILVLTFSNKAAAELQERATLALGEAATKVWAGTFHAFGLELLRKHHDRLGFEPNIRLVDRADAVELLEELLPVLGLIHYHDLRDPVNHLPGILSAISRAKDELLRGDDFRRLAEQDRDNGADEDSIEDAAKALEIALVYDRYEAELVKRKLVDYGDLIMRPTLELERDEIFRRSVQNQYRYVLVDEYQDVNRACARLLSALTDKGKRLWAVGDVRQAIYRFRGAASGNVARFPTDFPEAVRVPLGLNYRSSTEIVDTYGAFAGQMVVSRTVPVVRLEANRGKGGIAPDIREGASEEDEAALLAGRVLELSEQGVTLRDQAILCRSNEALARFSGELERRNIPVLYLGSLFERDEVRDLLSLLSFVSGPYANALMRIAALPRYAVPLQDTVDFVEACTKAGAQPLEFLLGYAPPSGSDQAVRGLNQLQRDLREASRDSMPWTVIADFLLETTDTLRDLASGGTVATQMQCLAIWQFANFAREPVLFGQGLPIRRLLERVRRLLLLNDERDLRQIPLPAQRLNAVRLMTVHGAKGLEFEAVHLPSLVFRRFPTIYRGFRYPVPNGLIEEAGPSTARDYVKANHEEEEECLFYVALSRARTYLHFYRFSSLNGKALKASKFFGSVPPAVRVVVSPHREAPRLAAPRYIVELRWPASVTFGFEALAGFEKCPRRFFYFNIARLRGRQKDSAFLLTHGCIYELVDWVVESSTSGAPSGTTVTAEFVARWEQSKLAGHAYETQYRELAESCIGQFLSLIGTRPLERLDANVDISGLSISYVPSHIVKDGAGGAVVRAIRSGKPRRDETKQPLYGMHYFLASQALSAIPIRVEVLHLATGERTEVPRTPKLEADGHSQLTEAVALTRAGEFPPERDMHTCPRCPHFFYCATAPAGELAIAPS